MIKLLVFDMDGTLAPFNHPALPQVSSCLSRWEKMGIKIGFSSGKNTEYLMGFARAAGVDQLVAFGESGATLHDGQRFIKTQFAARNEAADAFAKVIAERLGERIFFQDNVVNLAVFTDSEQTTKEVRKMTVDYGLVNDPELIVYFQPDGVTDILPSGVDKGTSLQAYMREYGIAKEEVVAAGDGINDLPMAKVAGRFIIVGDKITVNNGIRVKTTLEMLELIDSLVTAENT